MLKLTRKLTNFPFPAAYAFENERSFDTILNLGCGKYPNPLFRGFKFINCDIKKGREVDIILDLDRPLPFKGGVIDKVVLHHVMCHIKHPLKLWKEIDRILRYGGEVAKSACECSDSRYNVDGVYRKERGKTSRNNNHEIGDRGDIEARETIGWLTRKITSMRAKGNNQAVDYLGEEIAAIDGLTKEINRLRAGGVTELADFLNNVRKKRIRKGRDL